MRNALPAASFARTNTRAVFGDYISIYDIQCAVEDGATVPIYYEGRLAKLELSEAERPKIERRDDLYLSTLRGFVEALGGRLELAAVFPEGRIAISGPREEPTSGHAVAER
jgi:hypothetical protein